MSFVYSLQNHVGKLAMIKSHNLCGCIVVKLAQFQNAQTRTLAQICVLQAVTDYPVLMSVRMWCKGHARGGT